MNKTLIGTVLTKRWQVFLLVVGLTGLFSIGIKNLGFEGDYRIWFDEDNPQLKELDTLHREFTKADSIVVLIKPKNTTVFTKEALTVIKKMTDMLWQTPFSSRVDSITNYQHTEVIDDDLLIEDLLREESMLTTERIRKIKQITTSEPILVNHLISPSGNMTLISVSIHMPGENLSEEPLKVADFVRHTINNFQQEYADYEFYISGIIGMNASFITAVSNDSSSLMPLLFILVILLLGTLMRSISVMIATLIVIAMTIAVTLGFAGWLGINLNSATVNVPTMIMTLAVADCIHIVVTLFFIMQQGQSKSNALYESLQLNLKPIFITSITTACGFLTMNFSAAPPMQDLGNLVAFGVMAAFIYSLTIFPIILSVLPFKAFNIIGASGLLEQFSKLVIRGRYFILPIAIILVAQLGYFITKIDLSDEPLKYFGKQMEFRKAAELMENNISGITSIEYSLSSDKPDGINDPKMLHTLDKFTNWLRLQPETDHVLTLSDTIKQLNRNMHNDHKDWYVIPENKNESAQYLLLYEMSLPFGLDLKNLINMDKSATRILLKLKNMGSEELVAFENRSKNWLAVHAGDFHVDTASTSLIFAHIGERNIVNMVVGVVLLLIFISIILGVTFKSLRYGLMSLLPNVLPVIAGFGIWGLINGQINMAMAVVASMTVGIIVDDTVHFLLKYQQAKKKFQDADKAISYTFSNVGSALLYTTLILCAGFGVLMFSELAMNMNIGMLTIIIIAIAFLIDFIVLPTFLSIFDQTKEVENYEISNIEPN